MKPVQSAGRRTFLGAALVGLGAALGAGIRLADRWRAQRGASDADPGASSGYDVSEFARTDPALVRFRESGGFETGLKRVSRIEVAPDGLIWVAGDRVVRGFDSRGRALTEIGLERPPHGLQVPGPDEVIIALGNFFEVYDFHGTRKLRSARLGENAFFTALAAHADRVFVADAGHREVAVFDRRTGGLERTFGQKGNPGSNPGFVVPSPYFDLSVGSDERLHVANPGRLRIETYTFDGRFESAWGQPGLQTDRFCGCCNPVFFARLPGGDFVTSEKGLTRIHLYTAAGVFQGAVAGPDTLIEAGEATRRAGDGTGPGAGFDVAVLGDGRVAALDPYRRSVRLFEPLVIPSGRIS